MEIANVRARLDSCDEAKNTTNECAFGFSECNLNPNFEADGNEPEFWRSVKRSNRNDGHIKMWVLSATPVAYKCKVQNSGVMGMSRQDLMGCSEDELARYCCRSTIK